MSAFIIFEIEDKGMNNFDIRVKGGGSEDVTKAERRTVEKLMPILANAITTSDELDVAKSAVVAKDGTEYEKYPWEPIEDTVQRMRKDYEREGKRK